VLILLAYGTRFSPHLEPPVEDASVFRSQIRPHGKSVTFSTTHHTLHCPISIYGTQLPKKYVPCVWSCWNKAVSRILSQLARPLCAGRCYRAEEHVSSRTRNLVSNRDDGMVSLANQCLRPGANAPQCCTDLQWLLLGCQSHFYY
jgi:hypothetical protein